MDNEQGGEEGLSHASREECPEGKEQSNTGCSGWQHPDLKLFTRKEYRHQLRKESTIGIPVSDERSNVFVCVVSTEE